MTETKTAECGCTFTGRFVSSAKCTETRAKWENGEITGRQLNAHITKAQKSAS